MRGFRQRCKEGLEIPQKIKKKGCDNRTPFYSVPVSRALVRSGSSLPMGGVSPIAHLSSRILLLLGVATFNGIKPRKVINPVGGRLYSIARTQIGGGIAERHDDVTEAQTTVTLGFVTEERGLGDFQL